MLLAFIREVIGSNLFKSSFCSFPVPSCKYWDSISNYGTTTFFHILSNLLFSNQIYHFGWAVLYHKQITMQVIALDCTLSVVQSIYGARITNDSSLLARSISTFGRK
jgi:hypothetical protein